MNKNKTGERGEVAASRALAFIRHWDPGLDVEGIVKDAVRLEKGLSPGEESSLLLDRKLSEEVVRLLVTVIFGELSGAWIRSGQENDVTKITVIKR